LSLRFQNRFWQIGIACTIVCFLFSPCHGEEKDSKKQVNKYFSTTSLSLVLTKGNNDNLSFSFDTDQNFHFKKSRFNLKGRFIQSNLNGKKKSEIYYSHLKYSIEISNRIYVLAFFRFERNKLAGHNFRFANSIGGGCLWVKSENTELSSEIAIGWNNENTQRRVAINNIPNSTAMIEKTMSASFVSTLMTHKLIYNISSSARVVLQEIIFLNLEDLDDYRTNSLASLSASINRYFGLNTSLQVIYERDPVLGYKHTDFYLLSSFVIKI